MGCGASAVKHSPQQPLAQEEENATASEVKPVGEVAAAGREAKIVGLKSQSEKNGTVGTLEEWSEEKGRWRVRLTDGCRLSVQEANLEVFAQAALAAGVRVKLTGLKRAEVNGQEGTVDVWLADKQRWTVKMRDGSNLSILESNLVPSVEQRRSWLDAIADGDDVDADRRFKALPLAARGDREIALTAVNLRPTALAHASEDLRADRELVLSAVKRSGRALASASENLRADRVLVLAAVTTHGDALVHAATALKADRDVVLTAVRQRGRALQFAAAALAADKEVVLAALAQDAEAFQHITESLRGDREVQLAWLAAQAAKAAPPGCVGKGAGKGAGKDVPAPVGGGDTPKSSSRTIEVP